MAIIPLLARQPIFNQKLEVIGYELLCRNASFDLTSAKDQDAASSDVLINAFTELSINEVVGKKLAFVNFTKHLISSPPPFPRQQLVVEVLENQKIDSGMLHSLKKLRENGYVIALDDFVLSEETECLIAYADIIKLDVLALTPAQIRYHIDELSIYGIQLLAEKIETLSMFEYCKKVGFTLFQGYFLAKPETLHGKKMTENKQSVLQLLSALHDPNVPIDKIERMIASDTLLSFKLLRLINSASISLEREVESLRQAILLLGLQKLRNWVNLLALSNLGGKPHELSITALTRARFCELLGERISGTSHTHNSHIEGFFTVGLLSTLDAFLDVPIEEVLTHLSLRPPLKEAILGSDNPEGMVLKLVQAHERGEWNKIDWTKLTELNITPETFSLDYVEAIRWVNETMEGLLIHT